MGVSGERTRNQTSRSVKERLVEPFLPLHVTEALAALGNLSLVIIVPCTIYNTLKNLTIGEQLRAHIEMDIIRFAQANQDIGKLYSKVNDMRSDSSSGLASTIETLLRAGSHRGDDDHR